MVNSTWNPKKYREFEYERNQPFFDLLPLIHPMDRMMIVDLGCGTGMLTAYLHEFFCAKQTIGVDSSKEMLAESLQFEHNNLVFVKEKIENFTPSEPVSLIFSNAALQWVPNHGKLFPKFFEYLEPGGQLALQLPSNYTYPTHRIAYELANEQPYVYHLKEKIKFCVLDLEEYSTLLYSTGFVKQTVRQQVYAHLLDSSENVIDWVKGALLNFYKSQLPNEVYNQFLKTYRKRLLDEIGWSSPFFFPMKRTLIWAQK